MMRTVYTPILSFLFLCLTITAFGQQLTLKPNFFNEKLEDGWDRPVGITFDENGQGYVWEKRGSVFILDKEGHKLATPLVSIDEEVMNVGDLGMLGFALDPQFTSNGYFYLLYVVDPHYLYTFGTPEYDPNYTSEKEATIGRITRYTADPATGFTSIIDGSRKVILGDTKENGMPVLLNSHGVGALQFGTDGTLLASCGDAGSYESLDTGNAPSSESSWEQALNEGIIRAEDNVGAFKSQQIDNLCGTIIRIDPETGLGLSSNPFYDATRPGAPRSKVWALGFRNPYRFIHVPNTGSHNPEDGDPGTLIIGDVGGAAWEEMNIARTGGLNFGWPIFEGVGYHWGFAGAWTANEYMPYEAPNCNSAGYNFQDLIKQLNNIEQEAFKQPCGNPGPVAEDIATFLHTPPAVTWSGLLWNQPPRVAQPGYDSESGNLKEVLMGTQESEVKGTNFAGFTSMPGFFYEDGPFPEEYHGAYFHADLSGWIRVFHFEEDFQLVQVDSFATWDDKGVVHIAYNPSDGALYWCNVYENEVHRISYGGNPRPESIAKADKYYGVGPLTVQFDGTEAFDPDGGSLTYTWDFGDGMSSTLQNPTHTFVAGSNNPQSYTVSLTVTDSLGLSDESSILISLNNTPPKVEITSFENGSTYSIEGVNYLPLEAEVSDVEHELSSLTFEWETFLHHNNHYHPEEPKLAQRSDAILEPLGCLLETYWYRIRLTVTDPEGLSTVDEREIFPYCGEPFVEFVELSARIDDDEIILDWSTEQEQDVAQFIVERTPNFRFLPIGEVAGAGQSMAPQSYSFADTDPQKGGQYYRLKILNSAGDYSYSNIVYIDYSGLRDYTIFPNPSNGLFNLVINEAGGEQVKVEFFNTIGQPMYKLEWETSASQIFREQLDVQQLEPGLYYYRLTHGDKEQSGSVLIVR